MGMQSNDGAVMFSSIALLQQRFRELERIKEEREERLIQMLPPRSDRSHSGAAAVVVATAAPREVPVKWFFHPELLYPCRPLRDMAAATLLPVMPATIDCEFKTFQLRGDSLAVDLWPSKAYKHVSSEVDVDTSLHL
ncbi:uncharacterized protein [Oryza sativa Japonica Group]|jgi:hypothetical protein|uniref:Os03g0593100 protein n=5 Tax=Oryza TaxID=4527 RepID=A0A0P0VZV5_ORYSJ|nr:uncharacterized protein LOC4333361 [Oryza sativa Japonica Group]XP_052147932.1 uncharacterized protein LOC127766819 [Oryza glaberrima]EAY90848.1 hypothetical protein OsI_12455 [Oryza sativa Indica Group]KAB8092530.1 hypothetical protein EE612_018714 [Oryza sativa]AAT81756.1 hypothetical protein [Oryza sativa Japonica Group]EAZ27665.1 hypothetical protein OsJ_11613 [Oryza sativa Japonica Group]KAF2940098.1 hypothetical protein DAI22_03g245600 [Oryza sativa Japonica Group]|eukprot:NP_001050587.1 Os03g0593100 [Oryza sativa Japonica Group]